MKNPVLKKKYDEGFEQGKKVGILIGMEQSTKHFVHMFQALKNTPGIGEKTLEKIKKAMGEKYLK